MKKHLQVYIFFLGLFERQPENSRQVYGISRQGGGKNL
jgi:hypothetical protein